ncbi:MAG TPA: magnesium transporter [Armatimonadetes bacterium]|nr:magnesium transporter [Armatimonadota bacterium]
MRETIRVRTAAPLARDLARVRKLEALAVRVSSLLSMEGRTGRRVTALLASLRPPELAAVFRLLPPSQRVKLVRALDPGRAAEIIEGLPRGLRREVLEGLPLKEAAEILRRLSSDDSADVLLELDPKRAEAILNTLSPEERERARRLISYPDDTAGGRMATEFVTATEDMTVEEAIEHLRKEAPFAESVYYLYVVDKEGRLVGVLSLRELILAPGGAKLGEIMRRDVVAVRVDQDQEEVAKVVAENDLLAVPVVDQGGRLVGIVTADDVMDILTEEAFEDLAKFAGAEVGLAPLWSAVLRRVPWLLICMVGELLTGRVIKGFEGVLRRVMALSFFMPVIMATGGNAGTQSLATTVRRVALGELSYVRAFKVVLRELGAAVILGAFMGMLLGVAGWVWLGSTKVALVAGAAICGAVVVGALQGTVVPIVLTRMGLDPALASGPFVTTLSDITSIFIYFLLAHAIVGRM